VTTPALAPRGESAAPTLGRREARLRPEFGHQYPGLRPGQWESAATLADRMLAWALLRGPGAMTLRRRPLSEEHFEFRGGGVRVGGRDGPRPGREDR
jgi:hypothetical protein